MLHKFNEIMKITIYTTAYCPFCKKAKTFLEKQAFDYQEKDVEIDHQAAQEMMEKSQQTGVPVLDIAGKIVVGFNPKKIEELLKEV